MGATFGRQWLTVRNPKGQQLLDLVEAELDVAPVTSSGNRQAAVQQGIEAYDKAVKLPLWLAQLIGLVVERFAEGPGIRPLLDRFPLHPQRPLVAAQPP